jgi:hypothetical protein
MQGNSSQSWIVIYTTQGSIQKDLSPLKTEFLQIIYKDSVRTSQETYYASATKPNGLMLFRETVAVYCENQMEHINTLCEQNIQF